MPLVITFQVEQVRCAALIEAVKSFGDWSELTPSSYLSTTDISPGAVMEKLQPLLGPADNLWVVSASGPWAAYSDPVAEDHAVVLLGQDDKWIPRDWDEISQSRP
jgi:hypothetical protein